MNNPACQHCNCTESRACPGGCFWVLPNVCSQCAVAKLSAAGMSPQPLIALHEAMRQRRGMGKPPTPTVTETASLVPTTILAALVNAVAGWVGFLGNASLAVATDPEADLLRAIAADTKLCLDCYDQMAATGGVMSRAEISALWQSLDKRSAPYVVPVGKPAWEGKN